MKPRDFLGDLLHRSGPEYPNHVYMVVGLGVVMAAAVILAFAVLMRWLG
jgi:hypothetical protein